MLLKNIQSISRCGWLLAALTIVNDVAAVDHSKTPPNAPLSKSTIETRFVNFEKASVHCGPAREHYVTGNLVRGASVEVYHQTKDGWCGIRPPDGSHDWLSADQAYLLPGGKQAEVVGTKVPAWIGTETIDKDQKFRWQIELQPSQKVDVIGELEQAIDSDKVRLWYKILPPPGEFRWIRAEALSSTPPKSRSTTVTLASTSGSKSNASELPQQAAFQEVIERAPVAGEYIEGEGIVIGGMPNERQSGVSHIVDQGYANEGMPSQWVSDEGYANEGYADEGYVIDESMAGESILEGTIIDGDAQPCPSCHRAGCTTCNASHQTDSFQQWDATEAISNPKLGFRPIGRIFGLLGLSVVEGERVTDGPGRPCRIGCGCSRCIQSHADLNPRSSGRLNHLPRPSRRLPGTASTNWLGMNEPTGDSYNLRDSVTERSGRSLLESKHASTNWHGIAPARLGSSLGSIDVGLGSPTNERSRLDAGPSSVVAASTQAGELHFSTPEIQQAMIDLSRAVAESMDRWDLREHASRAQGWIEQAADPIARGEARLLLERIESFEVLRRRSLSAAETAYAASPNNGFSNGSSFASNSVPASLAGYQKPVDQANPLPTNQPFPPSPAATQRNPDGTPASDASGWLVQVHSAEYGQPEYALTDDYGGLIAYVQPAPGMNLSRYLKQPVGIYGAKGYLPSLSARQIVAERIVRIR